MERLFVFRRSGRGFGFRRRRWLVLRFGGLLPVARGGGCGSRGRPVVSGRCGFRFGGGGGCRRRFLHGLHFFAGLEELLFFFLIGHAVGGREREHRIDQSGDGK